jgi:hypothetical protein
MLGRMALSALLISFVLAYAQLGGFTDDTSVVARTVTLLALGTNGEMFRGCVVKGFTDLKKDVDLNAHFRGLSGSRVPFGQYFADIRCADSGGASAVVVVNRTDSLAVVSSARHVADFAPGAGPEFHVSVTNFRSFSGTVWAQIVGVFLDVRSAAMVDVSSGRAAISIEQPGAYLLTIFEDGQVLCRQAVRIENVGSGIRIDAGPVCRAEPGRGVELRNATVGLPLVGPGR